MNKDDCEACADGIDAVLAKQDKAMQDVGWYWHYVPLEEKVNIHTHGFAESFNHPDFQIVLAGLPPAVYQSILNNFAERVKAGDVFKEDDVVENIIKSPYKVRLTTSTESQRNVLKIILPDPQGNLSKETQEEIYAKQWNE